MYPNYKDMIKETVSKSFNVRDDLKNSSVDEIKNHQPKHNFSICCANITGDMNIGNMIRSAVLFGCNEVYVAGRSSFDRRGLVGANNYIDIKFIKSMIIDENKVDLDWDCVIEEIVSNGYTPVFVETGGSSMNNSIVVKKPCFIFGNEGFGIPKDVLEKYNYFDIVTIPMYGVLRSLNVSAAAAIVMSDYNKFYWGD